MPVVFACVHVYRSPHASTSDLLVDLGASKLHALRLRKTTASLSTSSAGLDWTCWLDSTRLVDWFGVAPPSRKGSKER